MINDGDSDGTMKRHRRALPRAVEMIGRMSSAPKCLVSYELFSNGIFEPKTYLMDTGKDMKECVVRMAAYPSCAATLPCPAHPAFQWVQALDSPSPALFCY